MRTWDGVERRRGNRRQDDWPVFEDDRLGLDRRGLPAGVHGRLTQLIQEVEDLKEQLEKALAIKQ